MSFKENFLCVLLLLISTASTQTPEFLVHPISINTTDGTTVEFNCAANNAPTTIFFLINGTDVSVDDEEKGFMQLTVEDLGDDMRRRKLLVTASIADNNNSQIICQAIGYMIVRSNNATLLVQGPLSSVVDLSYSFIDSSTVNISWSSPFTLPGTNITGYNISATSNGTTSSCFTSESYYMLLLTDVTESPCNEITITVSGYNGLNGKNESLTGIYLPSATVNSPIPISIDINSDLGLSVMFDISHLCVGQYPLTANFLQFANGILTADTASLFALSRDNYTVNNILMLSEDITYTLVVSLSNLEGNFEYNSTLKFNTFSIQSVNITDTTNGRVCVECVFTPFSTDSECTVELVSTNMVLQYTKIFVKSIGSIVASGCVFDVIPGVYSVTILSERGKVVDVSLLPDISVTNIAITTFSSPTTTTKTSADLSDKTDSSPSNILTTDFINEGANVGAIAVGITAAAALAILSAVSSTIVGCIVWRKYSKKERSYLSKERYEKQIFLFEHEDQCEVCKKTPREPQQSSCCGSTFCQVCPGEISIQSQHPSLTSTKFKCPFCKKTNSKLRLDKKTRRRIMRQLVNCTNQECCWVGELQKDHQCPIKSNYQLNLIPKWFRPEICTLQYDILPAYRTIENFVDLRHSFVLTDSFYITKGGCELRLCVYPRGYLSGKYSHVSVYIMKEPNDDNLQLDGFFTIQILNWKTKGQDLIKCIKDENKTTINDNGDVGWGINQFVSLDLSEYLSNDKMCFRISFDYQS